MDPASIALASVSIAKMSAQCILSLTIWLGEVKSVDDRIEAFCKEMQSLGGILDSLNNALQQPDMQAAAQDTKEGAGSSLWDQIVNAVQDCEATMGDLQHVLSGLKRVSNHRILDFIRKPIKQFKENLESGEISILRQRILFYISGLSLPIQMMSLILQLRKAAEDVNDEGVVFQKLDALDLGVQKLNQQLHSFKPRPGSVKTKDTYAKRMESYTRTAETFVATSRLATQYSSGRSGAMSVPFSAKPAWSTPNEPPLRKPPAPLPSMTAVFNREMSSSYQSPSQALSVDVENFLSTADEDFDLDIQLTASFINNGKTKILLGEWENAVGCFRKAFDKMSAHHDWDTLTLSKNRLSYLLAFAYVRTKNYKEAKKLLTPLLSPKITDRVLTYSAAHTVAEIYLLENKLREAEKMAISAVKGRRKHLGPTAPLTYDSLSLVIRIYQSLNDQNEAMAWQALLPTQYQSSENETAIRQAILEFDKLEERNFPENAQGRIPKQAPSMNADRPQYAIREKKIQEQPLVELPASPVAVKAVAIVAPKHEKKLEKPPVNRAEPAKKISQSVHTGVPLPPASFRTANELGSKHIHASYYIEPYDFMRMPSYRRPKFETRKYGNEQGNAPMMLDRAYLRFYAPFYSVWTHQEIRATSEKSEKDWKSTVPAAFCLNLMTTCTRSFPLEINYFIDSGCQLKQFTCNIFMSVDRINHIRLFRPHPYHIALIRGQSRTCAVLRRAINRSQARAAGEVKVEIQSSCSRVFPVVESKDASLRSSAFKSGTLSELDLACLANLPEAVIFSPLRYQLVLHRSALTLACMMRHVQIVKILLATPQTQAVNWIHKQLLQESLYRVTRYFTLFLLPDVDNQIQILKLLIRAGADPSHKTGDKVKDSALELASYHHRFELVGAMRDTWQQFNWSAWKYQCLGRVSFEERREILAAQKNQTLV